MNKREIKNKYNLKLKELNKTTNYTIIKVNRLFQILNMII